MNARQRVLLFTGHDYAELGGWMDLDSEHHTVEDAKRFVDRQVTTRHIPAHTVYGLHVSTNGPPVHSVHHPAEDRVEAPFDWAHIVVDGRMVAQWRKTGWTE